jgi:hypothetical protein
MLPLFIASNLHMLKEAFFKIEIVEELFEVSRNV